MNEQSRLENDDPSSNACSEDEQSLQRKKTSEEIKKHTNDAIRRVRYAVELILDVIEKRFCLPLIPGTQPHRLANDFLFQQVDHLQGVLSLLPRSRGRLSVLAPDRSFIVPAEHIDSYDQAITFLRAISADMRSSSATSEGVSRPTRIGAETVSQLQLANQMLSFVEPQQKTEDLRAKKANAQSGDRHPVDGKPPQLCDGQVGIDSLRIDGVLIDGLTSRQIKLLESLIASDGKAVDSGDLVGPGNVWEDDVARGADSVGGLRKRINKKLTICGVNRRIATSDNGRKIELKAPQQSKSTPNEQKSARARKTAARRPQDD